LPNPSFHYWELTELHLKKAVALLSKGDDDTLVYACLELRKSLEAYAYDLLSRHVSEAPFRLVQRVWQADKVLKELLAIDPRSSSNSTLHMQPTPVTETEIDVATLEAREPWLKIGEDRKLPVDDVRKYYHALGRFLHVPTVTATPPEKVRSKAEEIRDQLTELLAPGRISFKPPIVTYEFECLCHSPIVRRKTSLDQNGYILECSNCGQRFNVIREQDDYITVPLAFSWECPKCSQTRSVPQSEARDGESVTCQCGFPVTIKAVQSWRIYYKSAPPNEPAKEIPPA
jgi:hypothetical protein